jgi:hypothetical protein
VFAPRRPFEFEVPGLLILDYPLKPAKKQEKIPLGHPFVAQMTLRVPSLTKGGQPARFARESALAQIWVKVTFVVPFNTRGSQIPVESQIFHEVADVDVIGLHVLECRLISVAGNR